LIRPIIFESLSLSAQVQKNKVKHAAEAAAIAAKDEQRDVSRCPTMLNEWQGDSFSFLALQAAISENFDLPPLKGQAKASSSMLNEKDDDLIF